jgi:hypothetical protein
VMQPHHARVNFMFVPYTAFLSVMFGE